MTHRKDIPYSDIKRTIIGEYKAFYKGKCIGVFPTREEADAALWNGPIGDDLVAFQRKLDIDRAIQIEAKRIRKAMEEQRHEA